MTLFFIHRFFFYNYWHLRKKFKAKYCNYFKSQLKITVNPLTLFYGQTLFLNWILNFLSHTMQSRTSLASLCFLYQFLFCFGLKWSTRKLWTDFCSATYNTYRNWKKTKAKRKENLKVVRTNRLTETLDVVESVHF